MTHSRHPYSTLEKILSSDFVCYGGRISPTDVKSEPLSCIMNARWSDGNPVTLCSGEFHGG